MPPTCRAVGTCCPCLRRVNIHEKVVCLVFIYSFLPSAIIIHFLLLKGARLTVLETRTLYLSTAEEQPMQQLPYLPPCCLFIIYMAGAMKDQGPIMLVLFRFKRAYSSSSWRAQRCRQKSSPSDEVTWSWCPCRTASEQQI